jgi:hypothetical protein
MRSLTLLIVWSLLAASLGSAQQTHQITLTWNDYLNPPSVKYVVFRASALCNKNTNFHKLAGPIPDKSYDDMGVPPGDYCYGVRANVAGEKQSSAAILSVTVH